MAENSGIRWTHHTFNPWIGCVKVSEGCRNCYAETLVKGRMGKPNLWGPAKTHDRQQTSRVYWNGPIGWNKRAMKAGITDRVFAASLADIFEPHPQLVPIRAELWNLIRATPFLSWMLLTKRPDQIAGMLPPDWGAGYLNVSLGTSVEDMRVAHRLDDLRAIPCRDRFVSYEPALGFLHEANLDGIHQVLYGGESGPGWRNDDEAWPRAMRARCRELGIAFFYKQDAAPRTEMGQTLDGERLEGYPPYYSLATSMETSTPLTMRADGVRREDVFVAMHARQLRDRAGEGQTKAEDIVKGRIGKAKERGQGTLL
jgi:protein gp37